MRLQNEAGFRIRKDNAINGFSATVPLKPFVVQASEGVAVAAGVVKDSKAVLRHSLPAGAPVSKSLARCEAVKGPEWVAL